MTFQIASGEGCFLKFDGIVTRDVWLDFSELGKFKMEDYSVFRPSDISRVIKFELKDGWSSKENGKPDIIKLDNSFVKNYSID